MALQWTTAASARPAIEQYSYRLLQTLPHDPRSFTQGLVVDGDALIESSGLYGRSFIRRYQRETGATSARTRFPARLFAEGIAIHRDDLYCLSWKAGRVLLFDKVTLAHRATLNYRGEGWGLAQLDGQLVMSNGSAELSWRDPANFEVRRRLTVTEQGRPVARLNDLTVQGDLIWANIWQQTRLIAIHPTTGEVVAELDLAELAAAELNHNRENVLNGIAWDEELNGLWVTGKRWQRRYLLQLLPP
ncbi:MAG: glutaminyl-peptide cyclotransferase [Gammaproteobacteria bacterium]|nr:glutaminyl-peptide cyclotransferase [Gammaproteobacteria bacterium]